MKTIREWVSKFWPRAVIGLGLVGVLSLFFPRGESIDLNYRIGAVWTKEDLFAPFTYPVQREERDYQADVHAARRNVIPVFERDENAVAHQLALLDTLFAWSSGMMPGPSAGLKFTEHEKSIFARLASHGSTERLRSGLARIFHEILSSGYLEIPKDSIASGQVALRRGTLETILPVSLLYDKQSVVMHLQRTLEGMYNGDNDTTGLAYKIGISIIRPNILFSASATDLVLRAAMESIPRTLGVVQENERIVRKNERITAETKMKLESLRTAQSDRAPESSGMWQMAGIAMHAGVIVLLYGIYLQLFRKRISGNAAHLALIAIVIAVASVTAFLSWYLEAAIPLEFLILVPAASMLLTIVFDSRVGFYGTVVMAFLAAGIRGNDYTVAASSLVAGALAVYTVRDVKNRTQIFRSIGFIFLGYAIVILALGLERLEPLSDLTGGIVLALVNAVLSAALTYGALVIVERTFKVTTELTLIELANTNHPLMRKLVEKAPGTYHHSMNIAALAEAAASAIGANPILARAGAMFHDIGKIKQPTYFVENQKGSRNRHDKLAPRMSSLIIAAHVKDGVAFAEENKLPQEIIDFIPMHHGTTRMEYFYQKARKLAEQSEDETKIDEINEQDYRYPGPKPQTRETGILMLADTIEATARAIDDPTPGALEAMIDEMVKRRWEEGELDECPLTLKDITAIKKAFLGVLSGTYHNRIPYPAPEKKQRVPRRQPVPSQPDSAEPLQAEPDTQ